MSKTPLQTAIEQIQKMPLPDLGVIAILTALLPTEREVIEDVWCDGNDGYGAAADYFTTKFNDNEKTD
jgi:hypothetical protein